MANRPDNTANTLEARFAAWVVAAWWRVLFGSLVLAEAAAFGSYFLEFSANYRVFFHADDPQLLALEHLEQTYSKIDNVLFMIVPEDGDATSEQSLAAAVWITEQAWQTPYSARVDSLANFQHTTADGDDLLVRNLETETQQRFEGIDVRLAGTVIINQSFTEASIESQQIFLPASLLIMGLVLALLTGVLTGVAATGLVIVLSVLVSMGMGGCCGGTRGGRPAQRIERCAGAFLRRERRAPTEHGFSGQQLERQHSH